MASAGVLTAGFAMAGQNPGGRVALVESYNGSSWTETTDINTARGFAAGFGTTTYAVITGGYDAAVSGKTAKTELWNGSSWTEVNDLNNGRYRNQGAGIYTAGIIAGGTSPPPGVVNNTETWDGTSWTETHEINTARYGMGLSGTTTATLAAGGYSTTYAANVEVYDGSSWTETTDINTARRQGLSSGIYTDSILAGGEISPGDVTNTEYWNGSSWTEVNDMSTARETQASTTSSSSSAYAAGGSGTTSFAGTEEWDAPATFNQIQEGQLFYNSTAKAFKETITDIPGATWASGGDVNTARYGMAASGDATNGVIAGGNDNGSPGYKNETEVYDGTSWTEVNNLNQERGSFGATNSSPYTDSVAFGGYTGTANTGHTETWNGSSWTTSPASLNTARRYNGGLGAVSTNALCCGGKTSPSYPGPGHTAVESWNGSSWTEVAEFSTGRNEMPVGAGTNTAAIIYGGQYPPGLNVRANTESFDGTSWTELNDLNTARGYMGGGGTQTIALAYGGRHSPGALANTESWNGTSWSEVNDISTARAEAGGASNTGTSSALFSSGSAGPPSLPSATEEWTASLSNKTITAS
jgi:hypothetical protein